MHAPYCHLWPAPLYNTVPLFLIKTGFKKKKVIENKRCVWVSLQFLYETFLILRRNERDVIKYIYWSACKVPFILV